MRERGRGGVQVDEFAAFVLHGCSCVREGGEVGMSSVGVVVVVLSSLVTECGWKSSEPMCADRKILASRANTSAGDVGRNEVG